MATRRRRIVLLSSVLAATLVTAVTAAHFVRPARQIRIELDGSPDQTLTATFDIDGTKSQESLTPPLHRSFSAGTLSYSIVRDRRTDNSNLSLRIIIDEVQQGSWQTDSPGPGVKGSIRTPSLFHFVGGEYKMETVN